MSKTGAGGTAAKAGGVIPELFLKLLPVQMIMVAVSSLNGIIDGAAATNFIGASALAATTLFFPIVKLMDTVNAVLLGGAQILCGRLLGKDQAEHSRGVFSLDMIAVTAFGALISLVCLLFSRPLCGILGADEALEENLRAYILGYAPGIVPCLLVPHLTAFMQLERQEKRTYFGMGAMIITNIVLDFLFVKVFGMGMFGLGLATSVSNLVYVLVLLLYYIRGKAKIRFSLSSVRTKDLPELLRIGAPGALNPLAQVIRSAVLNRLMLSFVGETGIAAFAAVYAFGYVFYAGTAGVSNAARLLVSVYAGEEDRAGLIRIMRTALFRGTAMLAGLAGVFILLAGAFTAIYYGPDAGEVYRMTHMGFLIFPLSMPFSCICSTYVSYYQCTDHMKCVNILSILDGMAGVLLFSAILTPLLGMNGVWLSHVLSGALTLVTVLLCVRADRKKWPRRMEDTLLFPDDFGVKDSDRLELSLTSMREVVNISMDVVSFCEEHGIDARRTLYAGLAVEEMAGNIILHGFDENKKHAMDARVILRGDELMIRLKDDCRPFDPVEMSRLFDPEDVTHNIGIRLVSRMSREMTYQNTLGLNVLTMVI